MNRQLDVLLVQPNAAKKIYQDLSKKYSAIEPPIWAMLLAGHCKSKGFGVAILDAEAENLNKEEISQRINEYNPRLICYVSYGQQPSSSTQNMEGVIESAKHVKDWMPWRKIIVIGGHVSALPNETLNYNCIDFISQDYGAQCLSDLLSTDLEMDSVRHIKNLGYKKDGFNVLNEKGIEFDQQNLDEILPDFPLDLIDIKKYRTALWHSMPNNCEQYPFMSLYTSLNCPFSCSFCCIASPFGKSGIKHWSTNKVLGWLEQISELGIKNVKIADEMALLNKSGFLDVCNGVIERKLNLNFWCYGRIDCTKSIWLDTLRAAGVNFIALGIESPNQQVRKDVIKGGYKEINIENVIKDIQNSGINVAANYIFGLWLDNLETMQETLNFAIENNTEMCNMYCAIPYPGSRLYKESLDKGIKLPETYSGYSQHSYDFLPSSTKYLSANEVLKFRDNAWMKYHTNSNYLNMIENKFGKIAKDSILDSTKIKLRRKLLED